MSQGRNLIVSECALPDAVPGQRSWQTVFMRRRSVLGLLPGVLASSQVLLFSMLLANTMQMCGAIV
jgi:hypothetical protein